MSRDPERNRATFRRWYERHRAVAVARAQATRLARRTTDPIGYQAIRAVEHANRKARALGQTHLLTVADILALWARQPACMACGSGRGVDHIQSFATGGLNVPANLQNLCLPCNDRKGDGTVRPRGAGGRFVSMGSAAA